MGKRIAVYFLVALIGFWVWAEQEKLPEDFDLSYYLSNYLPYSTPPDDFSYASQSDFRRNPLVVGINTHWDLGTKLDWVVQLGVRWIRTGAGWHAVEEEFSEPPKYNWEVADRIVSDAEARGLQIVYLLAYTPSWASEDGEIGGRLKNETARRHWRMFVRAIAERYRGRVQWWEIWNEPNNGRFWRGTVEDYVEHILLPAVWELRAVDSQNKIIGPSLETIRGARIKVENFFKDLKKELTRREVALSEVFDMVSQNVYEEFPDEIIRQFEKGDFECFWIFCVKKRKSLFRIYQEAGLAGKLIVLTEFGWRADKVGEERQASRIIDTLNRLNRRPRFWGAFIYCLQADEPWGIMRKDDSPRLVFWRLYDWLLLGESDNDDKESSQTFLPRLYFIPKTKDDFNPAS